MYMKQLITGKNDKHSVYNLYIYIYHVKVCTFILFLLK